MENFAYKIDDYIHKKLLLYEELSAVLEQEKTFIVDMDIKALWLSSSRKKQLTLEIERIRNNMLYFLDENQVDHGMNVRNFSLGALIRILPVSSKIKSDLNKTRHAVNLKKDEIQVLAKENKKYVQEYLSVIDGIMSNFAGPALKDCYTFSGIIQSLERASSLIHAEV